MENFTQMMFDLSDVITYQEPTSGLSERRVRTSPLPDTEKVLKETEAPLSVKYSEQLVNSKKPIDPHGLSTKMLRECLAATEGMTSQPSSLKWSNWGMISNGKCLTQKISEYHKTGKESILLDILENGGGKYQIFPLKTTDGKADISVAGIPIKIIAHRDGYRRNTQVFASEGVSEALSTCQGGGREHHTAVPVAFGIDYNKGGQERPIANCIKHRYDEGVSNRRQDRTAVCIPVIDPVRPKKTQNGRRFKDNGEEAFTLTAQDRHGVAVSLPIKEAVSKGYTEAHEGDSINLTMPESTTRRGHVGKNCAQTLDTSCNQGTIVVTLETGEQLNAVWYEKYQCYIAIRKLTPRECFRLQGWTDDYFDKAQFVNSDCQLYKQAGNGVTVAVVEEIGKAIVEAGKNEN